MLGAYHGVDPSMGWLFAVALGLQERDRSRVIRSLGPIAAGHLASIAIVVAIIGGLRAYLAIGWLRPAGACILIAFGIFRLLRPRAHPRWVAMRVSSWDLMVWSFLMATAHGAGLMLFPIVLRMPAGQAHQAHHHAAMAAAAMLADPIVGGIAIVLVHTGAMMLTMGAIAVLVYDRIGLAILRSAWINLDLVWAIALIAAGAISIAL
jgi:hypothetical protein